jgi:hypothetical protein
MAGETVRTGIELLEDAEIELFEACACNRCGACDLRREIGAYLDIAKKRNAPEAMPS